MKNIVTKIIAVSLLALIPVVNLFSQPAPPSNEEVATTGETLVCTNAPVGDGVYILLVLAVGYYLYQRWQASKRIA